MILRVQTPNESAAVFVLFVIRGSGCPQGNPSRISPTVSSFSPRAARKRAAARLQRTFTRARVHGLAGHFPPSHPGTLHSDFPPSQSGAPTRANQPTRQPGPTSPGRGALLFTTTIQRHDYHVHLRHRGPDPRAPLRRVSACAETTSDTSGISRGIAHPTHSGLRNRRRRASSASARRSFRTRRCPSGQTQHRATSGGSLIPRTVSRALITHLWKGGPHERESCSSACARCAGSR
jgi:hypothetical protein